MKIILLILAMMVLVSCRTALTPDERAAQFRVHFLTLQNICLKAFDATKLTPQNAKAIAQCVDILYQEDMAALEAQRTHKSRIRAAIMQGIMSQ